MPKSELPFDPEAFADWLFQGLKETVAYRLKHTFSRERLAEAIRARVPSRTQLLHQVLRKAFEQDGFRFEEVRQGDAVFHLVRKKIRDGSRRLVLIPGFGDSPGSWLISFGFSRRALQRQFDEILILDFPGYLGFLSHHRLTPSMSMLQSLVKTVCEANPPHTLVGHSLGGWLAGKYAQQLHADNLRASGPGHRIQQLILIAPSGLTPEEERQSFADFILAGQSWTIDQLLSRVVHSPKPYQLLLKEEFRDFYARPEIREFVESVKPEEFMDENHPFAVQHLTLIWGDHDQFVPTQWLRHWIERYGPYIEAYLLKDTGHLPQLERPQTLAQVVLHSMGLSPACEGKYWKKLQSKKLSFGAELRENLQPKRITHQSS